MIDSKIAEGVKLVPELQNEMFEGNPWITLRSGHIETIIAALTAAGKMAGERKPVFWPKQTPMMITTIGKALAAANGHDWSKLSELAKCSYEDDARTVIAVGQEDFAPAAPASPTGEDGHTMLVEAAKEFCRKVENGEAKSKRSYAQFKAALAAIGER